MNKMQKQCLVLLMLSFPVTPWAAALKPSGGVPVIPSRLAMQMEQGQSVDVILLFDDSSIRTSPQMAHVEPRQRPAWRQQQYKTLKKAALAQLDGQASRVVHDYEWLPLSRVRVNGADGLSLLRSRTEIVAVYENRPIYPHLTESLPLIAQPNVVTAGYAGSGVAVAVVDTGVDYSLSAFGSCTTPGEPTGCRVAASVDIADDDGESDDNGHGTNVSAIIAGVAPQSTVVVLDIFDGAISSSALVLQALDWVLGNASTYNIKAVNMSIGDNSAHAEACGDSASNPFVLAIDDLRESGISVVASAGNNGQNAGISMPACTPGVLSVGAVYDANIGKATWSSCTDSTTSVDKVACFSNSASYLSLLAPGALITAGGATYGGTSQASPHVAGAVALLAAARSDMSAVDISERLLTTGSNVTDNRNGLVFPRLNIAAALEAEIEGQSGEAPFLPLWGLVACCGLFIAGVARWRTSTGV